MKSQVEKLKAGANHRKLAALELTRFSAKYFGIFSLFTLGISVSLAFEATIEFILTGTVSILCAVNWWTFRYLNKEIQKWT